MFLLTLRFIILYDYVLYFNIIISTVILYFYQILFIYSESAALHNHKSFILNQKLKTWS